jgi:hypothetical protein
MLKVGNPMWPDFEGGSILDLTCSIARARGGAVSGTGLRATDTADWHDARTVILLVLDGVGRAQLGLLPPDAFLRRHAVGELTSVYPSTTATAITTFMTGRAPAAHGLTGWHVRCAEPGLDGRVLAVLPVTARDGEPLPYAQEEILARLCRVPALFQALPGGSQVIAPQDIVDSAFNLRHSSGAQRVGYAGVEDMLAAMTRAVRAAQPLSYIYAYWPDFDHCCHLRGSGSVDAAEVLRAMDDALGAWVRNNAGSDALLLVTADHGFIDAPPDRLIELESLPALADCLAGPLSGERRTVFCHVKPGRLRDFEREVQALDHACSVWRSAALLAAGRFGPGEVHPRLLQRIGDFTLEMRDDWTLRDTMAGERAHRLIGVHGGTREEEMIVPLVRCVV